IPILREDGAGTDPHQIGQHSYHRRHNVGALRQRGRETRARAGGRVLPESPLTMRNFNTRFRLLDTDKNIRLLYTLFILTLFAGFLFTIYWAHTTTGLSYTGIAEHYLGSDATFGESKSF